MQCTVPVSAKYSTEHLLCHAGAQGHGGRGGTDIKAVLNNVLCLVMGKIE